VGSRPPPSPSSRPNEPTTPAFNRPQPSRQAPLQNRPMSNARPSAPAPIQRSQPASRQEPNRAFIGIQNSQATRNYSNRGQQSLQPATRSAPAMRSAPVSRPTPSGGGGGGGGHVSGGSFGGGGGHGGGVRH
jgi:uncharacterized membrane protein YgcG